MKKRTLATMLMASMTAVSLIGCGGGNAATQAAATTAAAETTTAAAAAAETTTAAPAEAQKELIKVGIINNDPNESGYRTANDGFKGDVHGGERL